MATYNWWNNDIFTWKEQVLYGSSRVGAYHPDMVLYDDDVIAPPPYTTSYFLDRKNYEVTDHLGNVMATVSDHKQWHDINNDNIVDYYTPVIRSQTDYYPGGMLMPGRNFNANQYRFGYNKGSEKDDEISGVGNHFTTKFREGDTRLLTWWSPDPKAKDQPWQSPYSYMDRNPIRNNDPDGDVVPLFTMGVGGIIGAGVGLYDLSVQHGGFFKALNALSNGDSKSWAHLTITTSTGVALGSGVGIVGAMGIAGTADVVDQTIQNDFDVTKTNPIQTGATILFAGAGSAGGKIISKAVLKPVTQKSGSALSPALEKTTFPANNPIRVATTEAAIGVGNTVAEKITNYVMARPKKEQTKPTLIWAPNSATDKKKK